MNLLTHLHNRRFQNLPPYQNWSAFGEVDDWNLEALLCSRILKHSTVRLHNSCINRLSWNATGQYLASVSDDLKIGILDVQRYRRSIGCRRSSSDSIRSLPTQHTGNIFGVAFLNGDNTIATCARDTFVCTMDVPRACSIHRYKCHGASVKHLTNTRLNNFVFYTAAEDCTVRRFDIREPHCCIGSKCENVVVNLNGPFHLDVKNSTRVVKWADVLTKANSTNWLHQAHLESYWANEEFTGVEIKALALNPIMSNVLAVSGSDGIVRLYDLRKCTATDVFNVGIHLKHSMPMMNKVMLPRHFWYDSTCLFPSHLAWSPNGKKLAVTYERDFIYVYTPFDNAEESDVVLCNGGYANVDYNKTKHPNGSNGLYNGLQKPCKTLPPCNLEECNKMSSTTRRIAFLERHIYTCKIPNCIETCVADLAPMLLQRGHRGDLVLLAHLCKVALKINNMDAMHLYRRIQAYIKLRNYYMVKKLACRGMRLYFGHKSVFKGIYYTCLMMNNKDNNKSAIEATLQTLASQMDIVEPIPPQDAKSGVETANSRDDQSDYEVHPSHGASVRYSVHGWRNWPNPSTCEMLEKIVTNSNGNASRPRKDVVRILNGERQQRMDERQAYDTNGHNSEDLCGGSTSENMDVENDDDGAGTIGVEVNEFEGESFIRNNIYNQPDAGVNQIGVSSTAGNGPSNNNTHGSRRENTRTSCDNADVEIDDDLDVNEEEGAGETEDDSNNGPERRYHYSSQVNLGGTRALEFQLAGAVQTFTRTNPALEHAFCDHSDASIQPTINDGFIYNKWPVAQDSYLDLQSQLENPNWRPLGKCQRLCGHCNLGTDIAEVGFWGNDIIVSGSCEGSVVLYSISTGQVIAVLEKGHNENVNCVQVNPQGTMLATSGIDDYVCLWETNVAADLPCDDNRLDQQIQTMQRHMLHGNTSQININSISGEVLTQMLQNPQGCIVQ